MPKTTPRRRKGKASSAAANGIGATVPEILKSKSAVAREYIQAHPEVPNKAVFDALSGTVPGLKISDVTNARSALKNSAKSKRGRRTRKKFRTAVASRNGNASARKPPVTGETLLAACNQAVELAQTAGGIDAAIGLLQTLKSIRSL